MYEIKKYPLGIYLANAYLIIKGNHALLIDPGGSGSKIVQFLEESNIALDAILLTHGHFDHMSGVTNFVNKFDCPVYIDDLDEKLLRNPDLNCSSSLNHPVVYQDTVNHYTIGENQINNFNFTVYHAPGHTEGSVLLQFENHLFSGDVLFKQSIGRCDLPSGSNTQMNQTLQFIKQLNPDLIVYPGHGEHTTLHEELQLNPYL